jgi:hypothetical protein
MWTNISTKIKCPRGDCLHTKCAADEQPCVGCTCNQYSDSMGRTFRYKPTRMPERKERKDDKP